MSDVTRFSVSVEPELLTAFDRYVMEGQFATRSEAVRQILRSTLLEKEWTDDQRELTATLSLVYDHHRPHLIDKLVDAQHRHGKLVIVTTHVHLDHDHCLEVIILRGQGKKLRAFAAELRGMKGVHKGVLTVADAIHDHDDAQNPHHHHDH